MFSIEGRRNSFQYKCVGSVGSEMLADGCSMAHCWSGARCRYFLQETWRDQNERVRAEPCRQGDHEADKLDQNACGLAVTD